MKASLFAILASMLLVVSTPVLASDHEDTDHETRIQHYIGEKPETVKAALAELKEKTEAIHKVLEKSVLDDNDLEGIHEISYSLEAAVDFLREKQEDAQEEALDELDEAVQAIHYASENHEKSETRKWFDILGEKVKHIETVF